MELREIKKDIFDQFVSKSNKSHFMQTSAWGEVSSSRGYRIHHLGLYDGDELCATALLLEKKILYYSTYYCPRGFIADYKDLNLLKKMIDELKKYVKQNRGLYFRMDPDIILNQLNEEGEVINHDDDSLNLIEFMKLNGARHKGYTIRFAESSLPRFTFRISVKESEEEILKRMHPKTRKVFRNGIPKGISVYKGNSDDVKAFHDTMKETAIRKKLYLEPLKFFMNYYTILNAHDMSDIYVAQADINVIRESYVDKMNNLKAEKEKLLLKPNAKTAARISEMDNQLSKFEREYQELENYKDEKIILSSVITAKFKDKVWLIHGGNKDCLQFLNANYHLYYGIMMDAKKEGYETVDFFGSEGKIDKNSDLYGIYLFKSRFGGDFDEFIGEFDFIIRPLINNIINYLLIKRRKILMKKAIKEVSNATD